MASGGKTMESLEYPRYKKYAALVEQAIADCSRDANKRGVAYHSAVRLCSRNRDMVIWFVNEWESDDALKTESHTVIALLDSAIEKLEEVKIGHGINPGKIGHLDLMIENTQARSAICKVIASEMDFDDKDAEILSLYRNIKANKGFDLSAA